MGHRGFRKIRCFTAVLLMLILSFCGVCRPVRADSSNRKIMQLYVNKPDITVYYRHKKADRKLAAYLDGVALSHDKDLDFKDADLAIEHYLLVDISGSISEFDRIREAILEFRGKLRKQDRMVMVTFGDAVKKVLDGSETAEQAASVLEGIGANDSTTVLAEAVKETAAMMETAADPEKKLQTMIIISDGKPDTDNKASIDNAESTLITKGIQAYTVAVDNKEGDSKEAVNSYRSRFNDIAAATGGLSATVDSADVKGSVLNGLLQAQDDLLASRIAVFGAPDNKVSHKTEEFVLEFKTKGVKDTRKVLVDSHQADKTAPELKSLEVSGDKSLVVTYSEKVSGADRAGNYEVKADGKAVAVTQVKDNKDLTYTLVLAENFRNADYTVSVSGVTDTSEEANEIAKPEITVTVDNISPEIVSVRKNQDQNGFVIQFSENVEGAEDPESYTVTADGEEQEIARVAGSEDSDSSTYEIVLKKRLRNADYEIACSGITDAKTGKNELKEPTASLTLTNVKEPTTAELVLQFLRDWWPFVLTALVLIMIILILRFVKKVRSNKYTIVDGEVVETDNVEEKFHVGMEQVRQWTPIVMWLSNGRDEPKKVERILDGSLCIGRSPKVCDIYCDDPMMSKQHFILSKESDGNFYVTDLESRNGTMVNGVRITEKRRIMPDDEVSAGNIRFRFDWR